MNAVALYAENKTQPCRDCGDIYLFIYILSHRAAEANGYVSACALAMLLLPGSSGAGMSRASF